jgi:hypothetical protein
MHPNRHCAAFHGPHQIASGKSREVALRCKALLERNDSAQILIFDDLTSEPIELDFRGTSEDVARRVAPRNRRKKSSKPGGRGAQSWEWWHAR